MRIVHINTHDTGGAGKACIRLSHALAVTGLESRILTLHKKTSDSQVQVYRVSISEKIGNLCIRLFHRTLLFPRRERADTFSFANTGYRIEHDPLVRSADIVNLHWTAFFLDYRSFFCNGPRKIVWTLHDMGPFSAGNHYTEPPHVPERVQDKIARLKAEALAHAPSDMTIVAPSRWLLEKSKASSLFSRFAHVHIPNGVDSTVFIPHDRHQSREELGIPRDAKVLLFVAESTGSKRKGFAYLEAALESMRLDTEVLLCVVGAADPALLGKFKDIHTFGYVRDENTLSKIYAAADVFVIPSLEDNLPNTMLESLMCGTPVVGFAIGGIGETIEHGVNGMLTKTIDAEELARTLREAFLTTFDRSAIRAQAVTKYDLSLAAAKYARLYESLLKDLV